MTDFRSYRTPQNTKFDDKLHGSRCIWQPRETCCCCCCCD